MGVGRVDGDAPLAQQCDLRRARERPRDDEIGREQEDAFDVEREGIAHHRKRTGSRRVIGALDDADHR